MKNLNNPPPPMHPVPENPSLTASLQRQKEYFEELQKQTRGRNSPSRGYGQRGRRGQPRGNQGGPIRKPTSTTQSARMQNRAAKYSGQRINFNFAEPTSMLQLNNSDPLD